MSLSGLLTAGGTLVATAIGGPGVGAATGAAIQASGVGGSSQTDPQGRRWCPGRPSAEQIDAVRRSASAAELQPVIRHWDGSRGREIGGFYNVAADEIGYWLMGNRDCRHSDPQGIVVQDRFIELVRKYGGSGALTVVQGQPTGGATQVGQAIKTGVEDFVGGIVRGAGQGAATAAQTGGAASANVATLTGILPLVLVLGLAAFIILRK